MHRHRLLRLALLTQGAALVSLGAGGCSKDTPPVINSPPDPNLHINAPAPSSDPVTTPSTTTTPSATDADLDAGFRRRPTMNAPVRPMPH